MPNWAVVIGVDTYAAPHLNLKGAVRDAIGMAEFLTGGPTPLVEPSRVMLLLAPTPGSPTPSPALAGVDLRGATRQDIINAIKDVAGKQASGGQLFLHFSGHGLFGPGLTGGEAILPSNYHPDDPGISISVTGIRDVLRTSQFNDQFIFIDACRNTPLPDNFNIGQFPVTPAPDAMNPGVQQFVFCATLRGVKAIEDRRVINDETGAFSASLLRGLRGERDAKRFDEASQSYKVTVNRLLGFVRAEVARTVRQLGLPPLENGAHPQDPRLLGEMGNVEAVIAPVPPQSVTPVNLSFVITPPEAAPVTAIVVRREADLRSGPPIEPSTAVPVPPRDYRVLATADGFRPLKPSWPVEPYEDTRVRIEFELALPETQLEAIRTPVPPGPSSIEFQSTDPATMVRLVGPDGKVLATARERIVLPDVPDGRYRGQLVLSDGSVIERVIDVAPDTDALAVAEAPRRQDVVVLGSILLKDQDPESRPTELRLDTRASRPGARVDSDVRPLVMLPVLRGWFTRLVVTATADSAHSAWVLFEPPDGIDSRQAERLVAAQRYFQHGILDGAQGLAEADVDNPIGALVVAYSCLRLAHMAHAGAQVPRPFDAYAAQLGELAAALADRYRQLSDTPLMQAEVALARGDLAGAASHVRASLDAGLPLMAFGAQRLATHVHRMNIEHPRRGLLDRATSTRRIAAWILTAWLDD